MRRIILTHGILAGAVIIGSMILVLQADMGHGAGGAWLGYLIMLVALSLIFIGIKRYRDRELGGVIKFGTAALLGLGITLVASVIYVAVWETYESLTDYAFIEQYTQSVLAAKEAKGLSGSALEAEAAKLELLKTQYANPLFRLPMTFLEIFPVGLLITLVAAALLRNSRFLPA
jgi:Protein of unknown function (DUF4199)